MKKMLKFTSVLSILIGLVLVFGGVWGLSFTQKNIAQEKITTPEDASIPNVAVSGPMTLKAQGDIIREHTLKSTSGKTYAEMPQQVPQLDESGNQVIGADGKPVMVSNTARNIWVTATTLITALNLGIFAYVFSYMTILLGIMFFLIGLVFCALSRRF